MASSSSSYIEFKIERAADVDVGSSTSDDDESSVTNVSDGSKKGKYRWSCGLRRSSTSHVSQMPRKMELKVSFTVQGVHSFCLRDETYNVLHGDETHCSVTLQGLGCQSADTWRGLISSCLSGVIPTELMEAMSSKLQRDLSTVQVPYSVGKGVRRSKLLVLHVHISVKVVTRDMVTEEKLLDRVSTPVLKGDDEDCVICLDGLDHDERGLRKMVACSHVFHGECLLRWLLKRPSCPVCWSACLALFLPTAISR